MFNALEPWHLLIIVGVLVVLFGAKRLPGSARSIGRSMRIFRSEMTAGRHDDTDSAPTATNADADAPSAITPAASTPFTTQPDSTPAPSDTVTGSRA